MNQTLWICLLLAITGCKTYHATPVAIDKIVDQGDVLVKGISQRGVTKFDNITKSDDQYLGIRKENEYPLDPDNELLFYPRKYKNQRAHQIWLQLSNGSATSGTFYQVTDSSVLILADRQIEYPHVTGMEDADLKEYLAEDIVNIKIRQIKIRGRVAKNAALGLGALWSIALFTSLYVREEQFPSAALPLGFFFGASYGALAGSILGSIKSKFPINQDPENLQFHMDELLKRSVNTTH